MVFAVVYIRRGSRSFVREPLEVQLGQSARLFGPTDPGVQSGGQTLDLGPLIFLRSQKNQILLSKLCMIWESLCRVGPWNHGIDGLGVRGGGKGIAHLSRIGH